MSCSKYVEPIKIELNPNLFAVIAPTSSFRFSCKNDQPKVINPLSIGLLLVTIPCNCQLDFDGISLTPGYSCGFRSNSSEFHHLIPAPFTSLRTPIITDQSHFSNISELINHQWHSSIPHTNYSEPPLPPAAHEPLEIPSEIYTSAYMSYASTLILFLFGILIFWIIYRVFCIAVPIFPGVGAMDLNHIEIIQTSTDLINMLLLFGLFIIGIIIIRRLSRRKRLSPQSSQMKRVTDKSTETNGKVWCDAVPPRASTYYSDVSSSGSLPHKNAPKPIAYGPQPSAFLPDTLDAFQIYSGHSTASYR